MIPCLIDDIASGYLKIYFRKMFLCYIEIMQKSFLNFLIISVIISGSGIPVPLHYCMMMKENSISGCEACIEEEESEEISDSCCEDEIPSGATISSPSAGKCCETHLVGNKIEIISLIQNQVENQLALSGIVLSNDLCLVPETVLTKVFYTDTSPPQIPKLIKSTVLLI